ncbi:MAG: ATP-dependent sacrificial sulfur transferase LarE [Actinomycetota bacterium]
MGGDLQAKLGDLNRLLREISEAVVAFSGGADSALLAVVAHQVMGSRMVAAIADSPSLPRHELSEAKQFAQRHAFALETIKTKELNDPRYRSNSADRCGFCKDALLDGLTDHPLLAGRTLLLGVNTDDLHEHRPGQSVARSRGARFPLAEAGLSKEDVRSLSRELGLETWDKPAAACLASRIAYGVPVTSDSLARVERAEDALRSLGLSGDVRVRDQGGDIARIEVDPVRFENLLSVRQQIVDALRDAGFRYVTLDLEGFRSGSHNLALIPVESVSRQNRRG